MILIHIVNVGAIITNFTVPIQLRMWLKIPAGLLREMDYVETKHSMIIVEYFYSIRDNTYHVIN